jgi:predicted secreted protein
VRWTSIIAIYALFWVLSAFLVMPFGVRTHDEAGIAKLPDRPTAPRQFQRGSHRRRATVVALVLFGAFMLTTSTAGSCRNDWISSAIRQCRRRA